MIILERTEENLAILETDTGFLEVPRQQLPPDAKEGDVLQQTATGYAVDAAATQKRRDKLRARTKRLTS